MGLFGSILVILTRVMASRMHCFPESKHQCALGSCRTDSMAWGGIGLFLVYFGCLLVETMSSSDGRG
jgi:hypothetical protein